MIANLEIEDTKEDVGLKENDENVEIKDDDALLVKFDTLFVETCNVIRDLDLAYNKLN